MKTIGLVLLLALLLPLVGPAAGKAAEDESEAMIKTAVERFLRRVSDDEVKAAADELFGKYWYDTNQIASMSAALQAQFQGNNAAVQAALGRPLRDGVECLGAIRSGGSTWTLVCAQKRQRGSVPFLFQFYRHDREWKLTFLALGPNAQGASMQLVTSLAMEKPTTPAEKHLKKALDSFMQNISDDKVDDAFKVLLKEDLVDLDAMPSGLGTLKAQYLSWQVQAGKSTGKPIRDGFDYLGMKRLGKSVMQLGYQQNHENVAVGWAFTFYKATDQWTLIALNFGDKAGQELSALGVVERAK
jgi:hypothetical protein